MKKYLALVSLLLVPAGVGFGVYWQRTQSLPRQLARARALVGTRPGSPLLEKLTSSYSNNAEVWLLHGRQLRLEGKSAAARASLNRASELGWPQAETRRELVLARAQTEFRQVEPELQSLLDADADDREVALALALGWSRQQNLRRAESLINSLLERDPADGAALCVRGRLRLQKGQPHDARPDLEKAVLLGEDRCYLFAARLLLANCLLELGRFAEALNRFRECQADEPENPRVLFGIGRSAFYLDRWDEAAEAFRALLQVQPDHLEALSQLAYILEERGELPQAEELLERAIGQDPTWYDLHFRLARILRALGQQDRAAHYQARAEEVKKQWAKPRTHASTASNPYTGEESRWPRIPLDP